MNAKANAKILDRKGGREMWKTKRVLFITCLSALSLFLFAPARGTCAESQYQITETELAMLETHLDALEKSNATLKAILSESGEELTIALKALDESRQELTRLKAELTQCKNDALNAKSSLETANQELAKAAQSFKQYEKERDRVENRLRTQRNIWEILCAVAVGVAVAR